MPLYFFIRILKESVKKSLLKEIKLRTLLLS
jgi:hypothetical protein